MLVSFGAKNFSSFKEGFEISFKLGKNCPHEISKGKDISNLICIKGANGSGKTNILKALNFLARFISESFSLKPDDGIPFDSYFFVDEPSDFFVTFMMHEVQYTYEATLTNRTILSEKLYKKNQRKVLLFKRKGNHLVSAVKEYEDLQKIPFLRDNASIISTSSQFGFYILEEMRLFFRNIFTNVSYAGLIPDTFEFEAVNEFFFKHPDYLDFTKKIISKFDPAIKDIYIKEAEVNIALTGGTQKKYIPWFVYEVEGHHRILPFALQSSGTKALYKQLLSYKGAIESGSVLILDEFDINLHPHILPHLLDMFLDDDLNVRGAQIIFTTHNTDILDFLGRYRTYLVNKDETESYCYRLDEIPGDILRNDRPIAPAYNQGKIGGVPSLWVRSLGIQKPKNF
nr:AAA family ATPase [Providencia rettgeri]